MTRVCERLVCLLIHKTEMDPNQEVQRLNAATPWRPVSSASAAAAAAFLPREQVKPSGTIYQNHPELPLQMHRLGIKPCDQYTRELAQNTSLTDEQRLHLLTEYRRQTGQLCSVLTSMRAESDGLVKLALQFVAGIEKNITANLRRLWLSGVNSHAVCMQQLMCPAMIELERSIQERLAPSSWSGSVMSGALNAYVRRMSRFWADWVVCYLPDIDYSSIWALFGSIFNAIANGVIQGIFLFFSLLHKLFYFAMQNPRFMTGVMIYLRSVKYTVCQWWAGKAVVNEDVGKNAAILMATTTPLVDRALTLVAGDFWRTWGAVVAIGGYGLGTLTGGLGVGMAEQMKSTLSDIFLYTGDNNSANTVQVLTQYGIGLGGILGPQWEWRASFVGNFAHLLIADNFSCKQGMKDFEDETSKLVASEEFWASWGYIPDSAFDTAPLNPTWAQSFRNTMYPAAADAKSTTRKRQRTADSLL